MKTGYFEEAPEKKSSMRLMTFTALIVAIALSFMLMGYHTKGNPIDLNALWFVSIWIVGAFAPKAVQKFAENANDLKGG